MCHDTNSCVCFKFLNKQSWANDMYVWYWYIYKTVGKNVVIDLQVLSHISVRSVAKLSPSVAVSSPTPRRCTAPSWPSLTRNVGVRCTSVKTADTQPVTPSSTTFTSRTTTPTAPPSRSATINVSLNSLMERSPVHQFSSQGTNVLRKNTPVSSSARTASSSRHLFCYRYVWLLLFVLLRLVARLLSDVNIWTHLSCRTEFIVSTNFQNCTIRLPYLVGSVYLNTKSTRHVIACWVPSLYSFNSIEQYWDSPNFTSS